MYQENIVLCGASAYEQKYYFNQDFQSLPERVRQELQIMCVLFTEEKKIFWNLWKCITESFSWERPLTKPPKEKKTNEGLQDRQR